MATRQTRTRNGSARVHDVGMISPPVPVEDQLLGDLYQAQWINSELAVADTRRYYRSGVVGYNPSDLVTRKGMRVFDSMKRDDQVKAAMAFKKHAVLATGWEVQSPQELGDDWEPTEFLRTQLDGLPGTFSACMLNVLSALDYGFSVTEKVLSPIPDGKDYAGAVGLVGLKTKRPHDFDFDTDQFGNLRPEGLIQRNTPLGTVNQQGGVVRLPVGKFLIYTNTPEFSNHYGISDLEAAHRPWWEKDNAYKWMGICLERFGIPPIFAIYAAGSLNDAQKSALQTVLSKLRAASTGIIPRGKKDDFELWSPELAGNIARAFIPAIEMMNQDIARGILMPGMMGVTPDKLGSYARAKVIFDVFMFVVDFIRGDLEDAVNEQVVRPLLDLNYNLTEYPEWRLKPITDTLRADLLDVWIKLLGVGAVQSQPADEDYVRSQFEMPQRDSETDPAPGVDDPLVAISSRGGFGAPGPGHNGGPPMDGGGDVPGGAKEAPVVTAAGPMGSRPDGTPGDAGPEVTKRNPKFPPRGSTVVVRGHKRRAPGLRKKPMFGDDDPGWWAAYEASRGDD